MNHVDVIAKFVYAKGRANARFGRRNSTGVFKGILRREEGRVPGERKQGEEH